MSNSFVQLRTSDEGEDIDASDEGNDGEGAAYHRNPSQNTVQDALKTSAIKTSCNSSAGIS